jgi:hypothetical protein
LGTPEDSSKLTVPPGKYTGDQYLMDSISIIFAASDVALTPLTWSQFQTE